MRISASPTAIERRQFGELADDVAYLRHDCGQVIAPYRDGVRVGQGAGADVITADQLVARAQRERDRRTAGRAATVLPKPAPVFQGVETPPVKTDLAPLPMVPELCACGASATHGGRCWHRRGWAGPGQNPRKMASSLEERVAALERVVPELREGR